MKKFYLIALVCCMAFTSYAQTPTSNCKCCSAEHQQFSFWEGNWETFNPDGELIGTNNIKWLQDSCILQENWISTSGRYTGTSYNFYNAITQEWNQTWVDNKGGSLVLKGKWNGVSMVLKSGVSTDRKGMPYINRITWTPNEDGSVQQLWAISKDEEATWRTVFEGLYRLKAE